MPTEVFEFFRRSWLWRLENARPDQWDLLGAAVCLPARLSSSSGREVFDSTATLVSPAFPKWIVKMLARDACGLRNVAPAKRQGKLKAVIAVMKLLIIEDEPKTAAYLTKGFSEQGFVVDTSENGELGLELIQQTDYDLVILDVMLPGRDGWAVLSRFRSLGNQIPVLMLTARDAVEDRVKGLNLGADDYLVKPFAFSELVARVRTLLRRGPVRQPEVLHVADLEIEVAKQRATRSGKRLDLTPKEFALLSLLARRLGEVVSRSVIMEQVWGINFDAETNVVEVHVRRLRSKVDDPFPTKLIHTVRGVGYVLDEAW